MCFYAEADWTAEVQDVSETDSGPATQCVECYRVIAANEWRRNLEQREHEECQAHDDPQFDENDEEIPHECGDDNPDCSYGEQYECDWCRRCATLLDAIKAVEKHDGCLPEALQPNIGQMQEAVGKGEGWPHYAEKMRAIGLTEAAELAHAMAS